MHFPLAIDGICKGKTKGIYIGLFYSHNTSEKFFPEVFFSSIRYPLSVIQRIRAPILGSSDDFIDSLCEMEPM